MLVGYARVSTDLQTTDGQIDALHAAGCERVFEESISGTRTDRPQLAAALEFAREGDVLVVARLDRLARSMRQLLTTVDTLQARGIGLRSLHENIDTTSATGRLVLHIFAALGHSRWSFCVSARELPWRPAAPVAVSGSSSGVGRHQGHSGEGDAGIRHHDGLRGRPAGRVQCLDVVSPFAGWTHRYHGESQMSRRCTDHAERKHFSSAWRHLLAVLRCIGRSLTSGKAVPVRLTAR